MICSNTAILTNACNNCTAFLSLLLSFGHLKYILKMKFLQRTYGSSKYAIFWRFMGVVKTRTRPGNKPFPTIRFFLTLRKFLHKKRPQTRVHGQHIKQLPYGSSLLPVHFLLRNRVHAPLGPDAPHLSPPVVQKVPHPFTRYPDINELPAVLVSESCPKDKL